MKTRFNDRNSGNWSEEFVMYSVCFPLQIIVLTFTKFSLEPPFLAASYCFDAVRIFDGPVNDTSLERGVYCGKSGPERFQSSTNHLYITFHSDADFNYPGFEVKFDTTTPLSTSGGTYVLFIV